MKMTILLALIIYSGMASAFTVEQRPIPEKDLPPIFVKAFGQQIHAPRNTEIFVTGMNEVCFRNYSMAIKKAHYVFTVKGMGHTSIREGNMTLTAHSAMCATNNTYFKWITGNAGRYGYEVITQGTMNNKTMTAVGKGTVYVGQ